MRKDIMGRVSVIGDTIIRAKYNHDSSLHVAKVIRENKNGNPKVHHYYRTGDATFQPASSWNLEGYVPGDFFIMEGLQL